MKSVFSALNGVIAALCFLMIQPVVENEPSDLDVVSGVAKIIFAIIANFGKWDAFFFQKVKAFSSVQLMLWNRSISSSSVVAIRPLVIYLFNKDDTNEFDVDGVGLDAGSSSGNSIK